MKFSDSPIIELPIHRKLLQIEQDNHSMHVGTSVWPCSLVLVKFIERWSTTTAHAATSPYTHLLNFTNKKGIELGSGCGPAGMGLYLLGLENIILTDIAPVMPALKRNLKKNKLVLGKTLKSTQLYWNNVNQINALHPPFDFVIAADVVYIEEIVGPLVSTMEMLVSEDGVVLLGYQVRSPEADRLFWELVGNVFVVEKIPHEHLHLEYAYEETDVFVLRKKKK
ncbi:hypothetical protein IFM89_023673 [Coptis chinensis]|uniref:Uncharacterized protein n=1 Tax=Coptis chinensis TaxID=261450 RepID=A0A835H086_9MAGN|nr:hypothetical protein IFM89_023673 [Coptis chinensis]